MVSGPHSRPGSPIPPETKRRKTVSEPNGVVQRFSSGLLDEPSVANLNAEYAASQPYKHAVISKLFSDELLRNVKDEILENVRFTEKETDIYKVNQTGDLASLSYLTPEQQALFPSVLKLREALYSPEFRGFLRNVTGCGPLSGKKQDMSVNSYRKGCHLLNHDDVIGTRRVSYILYMPLPLDQPWKPEWGGALELYPVTTLADGTLEPECKPTNVIPPSWNQFIFFEIQPGRSFHSVEEVVVDEGDNGRQRLSISGWFHRPQEGEEGYDESDVPKEKSSLQQLSASNNIALQPYASDTEAPPNPQNLVLNEEHKSFLSQFFNPTYLTPRAIETLAAKFLEESSLDLHRFLSDKLAAELETGIKALDDKANKAHRSGGTIIPNHDYGSDEPGWELAGPPHKFRYYRATDELGQQSTSGAIHRLRTELFPSPAFRSWLAAVTSLVPLAHTITARRFRPGLDYTLASAMEDETRLDLCLGLTPEAGAEGEGWETGAWGGWEVSKPHILISQPINMVAQCYMAPHEGEDDPEVYKTGSKSKNGSNKPSPEASRQKADVKGKGKAKANLEQADEVMSEDEDGEDDGGTLLTVQPGFNRMVIALRDSGVLKFVKYVSAAAPGSRWDVFGEWEVGMIETDDGSENDE
ncbi:hypothetical protein FRC12_014852 [Ceratobasidium sp. 428]|nr:hypothetical protein FRC12_014852 [Ceratobasidium sp. 428]